MALASTVPNADTAHERKQWPHMGRPAARTRSLACVACVEQAGARAAARYFFPSL